VKKKLTVTKEGFRPDVGTAVANIKEESEVYVTTLSLTETNTASSDWMIANHEVEKT
jgi:hypothetical protein